MHAALDAPAAVRPARQPWRAVHGVLLLDKPAGMTSQVALQRARRLLRADKAGHTGTLDPLAEGLLPLCFGAATKFAQVALDADKRYAATVRFGVTTDSGDAEGAVTARSEPGAARVGRDTLRATLARFTGPIQQVPPMHSALKRDGRPLYDYARAGITLDLPAREVVIHALDIVSADTQEESDCWTLDVRCSKGTYIRALARDLGETLGCGAYLAGLRRTGSGAFDARDAISLEALEALDEQGREARLLPPDALVAAWPAVRLDSSEAGRFRQGLRRRVALPDAGAVRVYGPGEREFLGCGRVLDGELLATRLLSPDEVAAVSGAPA